MFKAEKDYHAKVAPHIANVYHKTCVTITMEHVACVQ